MRGEECSVQIRLETQKQTKKEIAVAHLTRKSLLGYYIGRLKTVMKGKLSSTLVLSICYTGGLLTVVSCVDRISEKYFQVTKQTHHPNNSNNTSWDRRPPTVLAQLVLLQH